MTSLMIFDVSDSLSPHLFGMFCNWIICMFFGNKIWWQWPECRRWAA